MARRTRGEAEIEKVRERIIISAIEIMAGEGFDNMSMRSLASKLNMTVGNIYNYFPGKDLLYLSIQIQGFGILGAEFDRIRNSGNSAGKKLKMMAGAYISFGRGNPEMYDLMFNRPTPKYADYKGTEFEPEAFREKSTALITAESAEAVLREYYGSGVSTAKRKSALIELWVSLHGIVTLLNSRVIQEVDPSFEKNSGRYLNSILERFNIK